MRVEGFPGGRAVEGELVGVGAHDVTGVAVVEGFGPVRQVAVEGGARDGDLGGGGEFRPGDLESGWKGML